MSSDINGPQSASSSGVVGTLLELRTSPPKERADAARNRLAVLDAASRLFREHGVDAVSMDAVAAAAGVGKGTLFRRFGDKAGLAVALLDVRERALQEEIISGAAPLGPGTPPAHPEPVDRLHAFFGAYLDYVLTHLDLVRMSETASSGARYRNGAYRFWHRHVVILLRDAAAGTGDADGLAHALLATVAAEHLTAVTHAIGPDRTRASVLAVVDALMAGLPAAGRHTALPGANG